jgi:hypothetical protein
MRSQIVDRKKTCEFVVIVNHNQSMKAICCQYVSSLREDIVLIATDRSGRHDILDFREVRISPFADAANDNVTVREHANDDF